MSTVSSAEEREMLRELGSLRLRPWLRVQFDVVGEGDDHIALRDVGDVARYFAFAGLSRIFRLYSSKLKSSLICSKLVEASVSNDSTGLMKPYSPVVMDFRALSSRSSATSDLVVGVSSDACSTSRRLGRTAGLPVCRSQVVMLS